MALNFGEIQWDPERILNIKPVISKYNLYKVKYQIKNR